MLENMKCVEQGILCWTVDMLCWTGYLTLRFADSWDILVNTRNKCHISAHPCIILYLFNNMSIFHHIYLRFLALVTIPTHDKANKIFWIIGFPFFWSDGYVYRFILNLYADKYTKLLWINKFHNFELKVLRLLWLKIIFTKKKLTNRILH